MPRAAVHPLVSYEEEHNAKIELLKADKLGGDTFTPTWLQGSTKKNARKQWKKTVRNKYCIEAVDQGTFSQWILFYKKKRIVDGMI